MKKLICSLVVAGLVVTLAGMACASTSFLGFSGGVYTPDDQLISKGDLSLSYHSFQLDDTAMTLSAGYGVNDKLEVGITRYDSGVSGDNAQTIGNAKYRILSETVTAPSLVVGVSDISGDLSRSGDVGVYAVIGKNLTPAVTSMAGKPIAPLRGYIGAGTGIFQGMFAGASISLSPNASVFAEYVNNLNIEHTFRNESMFNAGLRLRLTNSLKGEVAIVDGSDLAFGVSFVKAGL